MAKRRTSRRSNSRKNTRKRNNQSKEKTISDNRSRDIIVGVILIVLTLFLATARFGIGGVAGVYIYHGLSYLFGSGYIALPFISLAVALVFLSSKIRDTLAARLWYGILFLISTLAFAALVSQSGGVVGDGVETLLVYLVGNIVAVVLSVAVMLVSLVLLFDVDVATWFEKTSSADNNEDDIMIEGDVEEDDTEAGSDDEEVQQEENKEVKLGGLFASKKDEVDEFDGSLSFAHALEYTPPPLSLLSKDKGKPGYGDVKANANIIKRTLQNFGIEVEMDEVSIGPTVTRYALKPAEGVRLSKIIGLQNNLELALAAHPVRIEAPIPGKSLVGIEVPNTAKTTVGLGSLLASKEYSDSDKALLITLGKGISGKSFFANLDKMPHLLVAGATGAGKSVMIHTLINSLLFRNSPHILKFLMIDPKRVELTLYNGIPHLLTPVVTDAKKTILALKWTTKEMERRYDVLEEYSVRDIGSYHNTIYSPAARKAQRKGTDEGELPPHMPYIVIIIDELADLMQAYPRELEAVIVRLAQMSRAVGIHLVLSTQRPSVNVITGLIKANIPTRIALQVSSQIDSRTILDAAGAEKLLGAGDMLFLSSEMSKPIRIQSAFISEKEVKSVVKYLKKQYEDEIPDDVDLEGGNERNTIFDVMTLDENGPEEEDDLYEEARELVVRTGKASTSYLQRKLRIGYSRGARLMDILEENGIIGEQQGSKPRDVLVKPHDIGLDGETPGTDDEENEDAGDDWR